MSGALAVGAGAEAVDQDALDGALDLGGSERLALTRGLAAAHLVGQARHKALAQPLLLLSQLADADADLGQPRQALLVLVHQELGPERQVLVDLLQRARVVGRQGDLLPHARGQMRALHGLDVQVQRARFGICAGPWRSGYLLADMLACCKSR